MHVMVVLVCLCAYVAGVAAGFKCDRDLDIR